MKNTLFFLAVFSTGIMASEPPLPPDELLTLNSIPEALFVDAVISNDSNIVGWGFNSDGQANSPPGNDFVQISAGLNHSLALTLDGTIIGWGRNEYKQTNTPSGNDFVQVSAGAYHNLALRTDGSIIGWGLNSNGQATPPDAKGYVQLAAGAWHNLALRKNGSITGWGDNTWLQTDTPEGHDFVQVAAGAYYSLVLKSDGSIVNWGFNFNGQATPPTDQGFVQVAAGAWHNLALLPVVAPMQLTCIGFDPPMDIYPVSLKNDRALPLKAEIFDSNGYAMISDDFTALPLVQVSFDYHKIADAVSVAEEALPTSQGDTGNQLEFSKDNKWQVNLNTSLFTASGTYTVSMISGDKSEYVFEPTCVTQFVIE